MNSGYMSYLMICISIILLVSGWREVLLKEISPKAILLFFAGWICFSSGNLVFHKLEFSGIYAGLICLLIIIMIYLPNGLSQVRILGSGLMLGLYYFLYMELATGFPQFPYSVNGALTVIMTVLLISLYRKPLEQLGCITLSLLFGSLLQGYAAPYLTGTRVSAAALADQWWLLVVSARVTTVVVQQLSIIARSIYQSWSEAWKERK